MTSKSEKITVTFNCNFTDNVQRDLFYSNITGFVSSVKDSYNTNNDIRADIKGSNIAKHITQKNIINCIERLN